MQLCHTILANDNSLVDALTKAGINFNQPVSVELLQSASELFYRDGSFGEDAISALLLLAQTMKSQNEPQLEIWRAIILSLCESPGWELY